MSKRPEILIENGPLAAQRFAVPPGGLRLGRSSSNDVHIPDEELSRNHCLFEASGDDVIRITDLASANGTYLNDQPLGNDPVTLKCGDIITVGSTILRIVGDEPPPAPAPVDLGLGTAAPQASASEGVRPPKKARTILWAAAAAFVCLSAAVIAFAPRFFADDRQPAPLAPEAEPVLKELAYEKVEADARGIFRYHLVLSADGVLHVTVDDVPGENRHVVKSVPLSPEALKALGDVVPFRALREIDREYVGEEPDPPALRSWSLKVVYDVRARSVKVVNTAEPDAFRMIRERLEAFSKNELGIWAIQYSREKLVALAEESVALGRTKWEDRDIHRGNLAAAIAAYREATFYLETVDPKPACAEEAHTGLRRATEELDRRFSDQRFLADRAINLGQWAEARRELAALLEMVPDRADGRNRETSAKLIDVEKRLKKGGAR